MAGQVECTPELLTYVRDMSLRDDDILRGLREETANLPMGRVMQVPAEEGQLLALLVGLISARTVVEVGTFTGYSTLCMARALPADGRVITCDITDRWTTVAAPYWHKAGVADRIDLRVGPAADTMRELAPGTVDLVFIDADKVNYPTYYELALTVLRPGGLVVIDNSLLFGRVIDATAQDPDTTAVRDLNEALRDDPRVDISLLVVADGITLAHKKMPGR